VRSWQHKPEELVAFLYQGPSKVSHESQATSFPDTITEMSLEVKCSLTDALYNA
jgi:hypothetical protein